MSESVRTSGVLRFMPVALALFCIQLDFFALGLALPVIAHDFGVRTTDLQWVVSGYMLALGALMIPASRVADVVGRKRTLLVGAAAFGAASLLCGLATSPQMLIAARVVQGVGGAMILPVAFSLVSHATTEQTRARVLGLVLGLANVGTAVGPIVGGVLASTVGWRWVFLVNVPFAVAAVAWGSRSLQESSDPEGHRLSDLDWLGAGLVALGVAAVSFGLDSVSASGTSPVTAVGALVLGVAFLVGFAAQERRAGWPLVRPALAARREFVVLTLAGTLANVGYCVMVIVVTIQLQQVRDLSAAQAGLIFAVPACTTALCGPISGRLAPRVPGSLVMAASIVLGALGLLLQAASSSLVGDAVGLALSGVSFGMGYTFTSIATQSVLPVELSGEASGVVLTTIVTLGGLGIVLAATGLELLGYPGDADQACTLMLAWTGLLALVFGLGFGWSQRAALRRPTEPVPNVGGSE